MRRLTLCLVLLLSTAMLVGACSLLENGDEVDVTEVPATVTPEATAVPAGTPGASTPISPTEPITTLTIWIPRELTEQIEEGIGALELQSLPFWTEHPGLDPRFEMKPVPGEGGILGYLRTGRDVAPSILPDLVALPTQYLSQAAAEDMIHPLDDLIAPELLEDLFPAADSLVRVGDQRFGYPFALTNLSHMAYSKSVITSSPPLTWTLFTEEVGGQFVFPAAGDAGALLALQLYQALGGTLVDDTGQQSLQSEPLADALTLLNQARNAGVIALHSSNVDTLDKSWEFFQSGSAALAQTTADQFLRQRSAESAPGFAPLPGPEEALAPLVDGWAWVVTTPNAARKALAVELLSQLVADPDYGDWSVRNGMLPSRKEAFGRWPSNDPYTTFLQSELERAEPNPASGNSALLEALRDAVFDVITLSQTPVDAAEAAVASLSAQP